MAQLAELKCSFKQITNAQVHPVQNFKNTKILRSIYCHMGSLGFERY